MRSSARTFACPHLRLPAPSPARTFACPLLRLPAPSPARSFVAAGSLCGLMACLLLLPSLAARAGTYDVTYSNTGTATVPGQPPNPHTYSNSFTGYEDYFSSSETQASCSGPITATFLWDNGGNANDLPPASAVVTETRTAGVYMPSGGSGSCNDGMNDTGTGAPYQYVTVTRSRYTVKSNPGNNFTVSCSPSATASGSSGYGMTTVSYSAAATPVTIPPPTGTTLYNGGLEILTGQQITASISASLPIDSSSYRWSTSGSNNAFKNYNPNIANPTATNTQLVPLSGSDFTQAQFSLYDKKGETFTLQCYAAAVTPDGSRLPVVAQSQSIVCVKPTETAWAIQSSQSPDIPFSFNYNNGTYNPRYGVQVTWDPITVTVPAPFTGGQVCLAQIASLNRVATRVPLNGASNTYGVVPNSQGLDVGFPDPIAYQLDANGNVITGADGNYSTLSPPQWNVNGAGPTSGAGGDRPSAVSEPALANGDTGGSDWRSSSASDGFDTWTMYQPPAVGGQPTVRVPLQTIHWAWNGSASVQTDAAGNVVLDPNNNARWNFVGPTVTQSGNPTDTTTPPTWTNVIPYLPPMGPPATH